MKLKIKNERHHRRDKRVRAKIFGTANRPRLSVFRSLKHIYAQIINDEKGETLVTANDLELKGKIKKEKRKVVTKKLNVSTESGLTLGGKNNGQSRSGKMVIAYEVGKLIAEKALKKEIKKVVFDRGGFKYHGRVKALADGARIGGLEF